jgi:Ras-related protein Rab-11A
LDELREKAEPDCAMFLVGNKYDLVIDNPNLRQVSMEEAKQWASKEKMHFMETSALLGYKVVDAFELLAECMCC